MRHLIQTIARGRGRGRPRGRGAEVCAGQAVSPRHARAPAPPRRPAEARVALRAAGLPGRGGPARDRRAAGIWVDSRVQHPALGPAAPGCAEEHEPDRARRSRPRHERGPRGPREPRPAGRRRLHLRGAERGGPDAVPGREAHLLRRLLARGALLLAPGLGALRHLRGRGRAQRSSLPRAQQRHAAGADPHVPRHRGHRESVLGRRPAVLGRLRGRCRGQVGQVQPLQAAQHPERLAHAEGPSVLALQGERPGRVQEDRGWRPRVAGQQVPVGRLPAERPPGQRADPPILRGPPTACCDQPRGGSKTQKERHCQAHGSAGERGAAWHRWREHLRALKDARKSARGRLAPGLG
mmetsp:Transcript_10016/g.29512  ORF Transcript_10016/g.29512 Transcript_10016/m.29512 type:complete len:352 (+) Transcript_10016:220-1275(+)